MKIAFVYDRVNKFGGAERLLLHLHKIWPDAPLYTAVYDKKKAEWAKVYKVIPSFLKYLPYIQDKHELMLFVLPLAFESFSFDQYDVVLSITSAEAKGIITKPNTLHICYCLTPTRYLWNNYQDYKKETGTGLLNHILKPLIKISFPILRKWDYLASFRPDYYFAISKTVSDRIKAYYGFKSKIIFPPVDTKSFTLPKKKYPRDYYLIVSRLVPYKRIDYAISAFNKTGQKLIIIGKGLYSNLLKKNAGNNIKFCDANLTDKELCWYYQNSKALIFSGEEDFGLTPLEAQACGRPVIAYKSGGVSETIIDGKTGILFNNPDENSLITVLNTFNEENFSPYSCRRNALNFSETKFQRTIKKEIEIIWDEYHFN
jgi:glycosyltransferase involved in cell wall biosynthesis